MDTLQLKLRFLSCDIYKIDCLNQPLKVFYLTFIFSQINEEKRSHCSFDCDELDFLLFPLSSYVPSVIESIELICISDSWACL